MSTFTKNYQSTADVSKSPPKSSKSLNEEELMEIEFPAYTMDLPAYYTFDAVPPASDNSPVNPSLATKNEKKVPLSDEHLPMYSPHRPGLDIALKRAQDVSQTPFPNTYQ